MIYFSLNTILMKLMIKTKFTFKIVLETTV